MDEEGQEAPQVVEIDDPGVPPYPHPIESETASESAFEVPAAPKSPAPVITLDTVEDPDIRRST